MSQYDFGTIDANVKTGTQLAADLNAWRSALHSSHSGAARPAYVATGMLWVNTSGAPAVNILNLYDGVADIEVTRWNSTTHVGTAYIPLTQKAAASGVASLDASTKIPVAQVPDLSATYIAVTQKGAASGVPPLTAASKIANTYGGAASSLATLDAGTKIPVAQIPDLSATYLPKTGGAITGPLNAPAGTVALPGLTVGGTNNGWYAPTGSQIGLSLNGVNMLNVADGVWSMSVGSVHNAAFEIGTGRIADGAAYLDLHSQFPDTDFSARVVRNSGANGRLEFLQAGTGEIRFIPVAGTALEIATSGLLNVPFGISQVKFARTTPLADNDGSMDLNAANDFIVTPAGPITLQFTNRTDGQRGMIFLNNGANYAITFAANTFKSATAAADLSATGFYILSYWCINGGQVWITHSDKLAA